MLFTNNTLSQNINIESIKCQRKKYAEDSFQPDYGATHSSGKSISIELGKMSAEHQF
jgi:hypothetical protein